MRDDLLHGFGGLEDLLGVLPVALAAELHHRRPRRGHEPAGPGSLDARRHVLPAAPAGQVEVLRVAVGLVAEQHRRGALEGVAVLVRVRRDARDAGHPEVERLDVVAELLAEREDEPAQTGVDVEADSSFERELPELGDRVDGAVAVVRRRAHDRDGVLVDELRHRLHVRLRRLGYDGRDAHLDAEQVARLVEGGMTGLGLHEVGPGDVAVLPRVVPVGEHRVQDAPRPTGRDQAGRRTVGDRVGVHQVERHGDHLALELRGARAHVPLQDVDVGEEAERLVEEPVVLVVAGVHRPGALPGLPEGVLLGRHRPHLGEHVLARAAVLGQRPVHGEPVCVREVGHPPAPPGVGPLEC